MFCIMWGRLRALMHGEPLVARVPVGHDGARLESDAGVTTEPECRLDDCLACGKRLVDLAGLLAALECQIVAELGVDDRRAGIERGLHVGDGGELLIVDGDELGRILGLRPRSGDDGSDRFALPARAVDRDRGLRR
jgi:hypothetical protein